MRELNRWRNVTELVAGVAEKHSKVVSSGGIDFQFAGKVWQTAFSA
jgi:hypothetical protein